MSMIYGEGLKKAFRRLQELIMKEIGDDSILAWGLGQTEPTSEPSVKSVPGCILANSPADFAQCGHILAGRRVTRDSFDIFGGSLRLHVPLFISAPGNIFGLLKCGDSGLVVGIPLENISNDASKEYIRPQGRHLMLVPEPGTEISPLPILVRIDHENRTLANDPPKYWFHVEGSGETGLEPIDVEPRSYWRKEESLIEAALTFREDAKQQTFVRFRHKAGEAHDFLVILELRTEGSQSEVEARCQVMTCDRDTSLVSVARKFSHIRPEAMGKQSAGNGAISVQVIVDAEPEGTMFFLRTVPLNSPPEITYNASVELRILEAEMEINVLQEEESVTEREAAVIRDAVQKTQGNSNQIKEELELLELELREMEARRAQLIMRQEEECKVIDRLIHGEKATISCQDSLAKRRSSTQRRLESLSGKASFSSLASNSYWTEAESESPILNWAAYGGHFGVVRVLLNIGAADLELKSGQHESTPLHLAVKNGHHAIALMLLDHGANIGAKDRTGETPLFNALRAKNEQLVRLLAEKGADVNAKDNDGETLLLNVLRTEDEGAVRLLVESGADISLRGSSSRLPLHTAVSYGLNSAVKLFLEKGVDIEAREKGFMTALHEAVACGMHTITSTLLENRAAVDATNHHSRTPLHLAAAHGKEHISKALIKNGANVNAEDSFAKTPLHVACEGGFLAVTGLLIQEGASIEAKTGTDETSLNIAVKNEHAAIVELLVQKGASMARNRSGQSPLHTAALTGNVAILQTLFKCVSKTQLNKLTKGAKTPLDCALDNGHEGAAKLLVSQGALKSSQRGNNTMTVGQSKPSGNPVLASRVLPYGVAGGHLQLVGNRTALPSLPTLPTERHSTPSVFDRVLKRRKPA